MIMNKSQAEAVYSAMVALNNVSGAITEVRMDNIRIHQTNDGKVLVDDAVSDKLEIYTDQGQFATAYGLK